jgi:RNA polymerase subunit RPABC4/transcription elongation factor Spt4
MRKEAEAKDAVRKRTPTPKPSEFAISLAAYIQTITEMCPLCGHEEEE